MQVPQCLNSGPIGIAINGIPFYNPYTRHGYDVKENIVTDACGGHLDKQGHYHYHMLPTCVYKQNQTDQLLGVAMDGFPIYGPIDDNGDLLTSDDLDLCHGRLENGFYVYRITYDFPYILGCYHGQALTRDTGHCMIASQRNPATDGLWVKRRKGHKTPKSRLSALRKEKQPTRQSLDLNSRKFFRMRTKIINLLLKRNRAV